jgi:hypothetical protein
VPQPGAPQKAKRLLGLTQGWQLALPVFTKGE